MPRINQKKLKVIILGSSGILGSSIYSSLNQKFIKVVDTGFKKRKYNFLKIKELEKLISKINPDVLINCSGLTDIDHCERNKKEAYLINTNLVNDIFEIKKKHSLNFCFIQFSTDQLYNSKNMKTSTEKVKSKILNYYTKTKLLAEKICAKNSNYLIFRVNFFGKSMTKKETLSDWILNHTKKKNDIVLFANVFFSPILLDTLSKIINHILLNRIYLSGIFNLGSKNGSSKLEFGKKILKIFNRSKVKITSSKVQKILKIERAKNMMMNVNKFEKYFKIKLPTLDSEIKKYRKIYGKSYEV